MRRTAVLFVVLVVTSLLVRVATADSIQKPQFTLPLPEGWIEIPGEVLQAVHDELNRQAPGAQIPVYDYGFQPASNQGWMTPPYILVQVNKIGRIPKKQLQQMKKLDVNAALNDQLDKFKSLMENTDIGKMEYDPAAHVIWMNMKSDVAGIGTIRAVSGMIPTQQGLLQIHCYSKEADFPNELLVYRQIVTTTVLAPELVYKPEWTDDVPFLAGFDWSKVVRTSVAGAAVGGVAGAVAWITLALRKKKEQESSESDSTSEEQA